MTLLPGVPEVTLQNVANGTVKLAWFQRFGDSEEPTIDKYELSYFSVSVDIVDLPFKIRPSKPRSWLMSQLTPQR